MLDEAIGGYGLLEFFVGFGSKLIVSDLNLRFFPDHRIWSIKRWKAKNIGYSCCFILYVVIVVAVSLQ